MTEIFPFLLAAGLATWDGGRPGATDLIGSPSMDNWPATPVWRSSWPAAFCASRRCSVLGPRFSVWVAIQQDHRLQTTGLYRFVRHPRSPAQHIFTLFTGRLTFRSAIGLLLAAMMVMPLVRRMAAEEKPFIARFWRRASILSRAGHGAQFRWYIEDHHTKENPP